MSSILDFLNIFRPKSPIRDNRPKKPDVFGFGLSSKGRLITCPACHGTGKDLSKPYDDAGSCYKCCGTGVIYES